MIGAVLSSLTLMTGTAWAQTTLLWTGDFETGDFSQYRDHLYEEGIYTAKSIVTEPVRNGQYAGMVEILGNERDVKERAELYCSPQQRFWWDGPEYWIGFSLRFEDWNGSAWTFYQIHPPDRMLYPEGCNTSGNAFMLAKRPDGWILRETRPGPQGPASRRFVYRDLDADPVEARDFPGYDPHRRAWYHEALLHEPGAVAWTKLYEFFEKTGWREAAVSYFNWKNRLPDTLEQIQQPIHCINSNRFPNKVEVARRYAPSFKVAIIPGVGHAVMTEAPDTFNRTLDSVIEELMARRTSNPAGAGRRP